MFWVFFFSKMTELNVHLSILVDFPTLVTLLHLCEKGSGTDHGFPLKCHYSGLVQFARECSGSARKDMPQAILWLSMLEELALLQKNWSHTQSLNSLEVTTRHTLHFSELVEKAVRITVAKTADNPNQILNWPWRTAEGSHDTESGYKITDAKQMPRNAKIMCLGNCTSQCTHFNGL